MIVQCSHCDTRFDYDESRLDSAGTTLQCLQCGKSFTASKPAAAQTSPDISLDIAMDTAPQVMPQAMPRAAPQPYEAAATVVGRAPAPTLELARPPGVEDIPLAEADLLDISPVEQAPAPPAAEPEPMLELSGGLTADGELVPASAPAPVVPSPVSAKPATAELSGPGDFDSFSSPTRVGIVRPTSSIGARRSSSVRTEVAAANAHRLRRSRPWIGVVFLGLIVAAGTIAYQQGAWARLQHTPLFGLHPGGKLAPQRVALHGVVPTSMRSFLYPLQSGTPVLIFSGDAENRSQTAQHILEAVAELVDYQGHIVATARAPLGVSLTPADINSLTDHDTLQALLDRKADALPGDAIVPGASNPYTVVVFHPPAHPEWYVHRIRIAPGTARVRSPSAEPVAGTNENDGDIGAKEKHKAALKGKRKGKGGLKKGKTADAAAN